MMAASVHCLPGEFEARDKWVLLFLYLWYKPNSYPTWNRRGLWRAAWSSELAWVLKSGVYGSGQCWPLAGAWYTRFTSSFLDEDKLEIRGTSQRPELDPKWGPAQHEWAVTRTIIQGIHEHCPPGAFVGSAQSFGLGKFMIVSAWGLGCLGPVLFWE